MGRVQGHGTGSLRSAFSHRPNDTFCGPFCIQDSPLTAINDN